MVGAIALGLAALLNAETLASTFDRMPQGSTVRSVGCMNVDTVAVRAEHAVRREGVPKVVDPWTDAPAIRLQAGAADHLSEQLASHRRRIASRSLRVPEES